MTATVVMLSVALVIAWAYAMAQARLIRAQRRLIAAQRDLADTLRRSVDLHEDLALWNDLAAAEWRAVALGGDG